MLPADAGSGGDATQANLSVWDSGMSEFASAASDLKAAVGNGATLDPETADACIGYLNQGLGRVNTLIQKSGRMEMQDLPIGHTPAADVYRPVYAAALGDPQQGAKKAFHDLKRELEDVIESVKASVRDMEDTEQGNAGGLKDAGS